MQHCIFIHNEHLLYMIFFCFLFDNLEIAMLMMMMMPVTTTITRALNLSFPNNIHDYY